VILTVTPNAAVDKTYRVEDFQLDRVNRPSQAYTVAGGKGINVARVYQTLGGQAIATGFLGGINGRIVARALKTERLTDAFVRIRGESRLCIAVIDPETGTQTEINESGPAVSARAVRTLSERVADLLSQHRFQCVVLSGSLPAGVPQTLYADMIAVAQRAGTRAVLDAGGPALRYGVQARPWMVKPNRVEMESVLGRPIDSPTAMLEAARTLHKSGIAIVAATRGAEGALLVTERGAWSSVPPAIEFASAVASGDSFLAAFLWSWRHGEAPGDAECALRLATGAGAANAAVIGAGFCTRESIFALAEGVHVDRLDRTGDRAYARNEGSP
jgi:1-phosphofructokinase family hexose kinase